MIEVNSKQTAITDELLNSLPNDIRDEFLDAVMNIPFINNMLSPTRKRASELEKDEQGRIVVDLVHPHILENMDYFRPAALHYKKYGCYTKLRPNSNPNSDFGKWIRTEINRIWYGMVRPTDGEWVPGSLYFYWNYCPILQSKIKKGSKKAERIVDFPEVWDSTYLWHHFIDQATRGGKYNDYQGGQHWGVIARRGCGKSLNVASMLARLFICGDNKEVCKSVKGAVVASDKTFLQKDGTLNKFVDFIDHCAETTQFPARRIKSSLEDMHWIMGYRDTENEQIVRGTGNEITGLSVGDKAGKVRGKRAVLTVFEEFGMFPNFLETYNTALYNAEEGGYAFGALGTVGCVCAGTKVYKKDGTLCNIEDINKSTGIIGFNGSDGSLEDVTYVKPIGTKECVRIETALGGEIRCSKDHPLLVLKRRKHSKYPGICTFKKAGEISTNDTLLMSNTIGCFGDIHEPDAYLLGMLFGDGSYSKCSCPSLSVTTNEVYNWLNDNYSIGISKLRNSSDGIYAQVYFRGLKNLLCKYDMFNKAWGNKRFPNTIWQWDKQSICDFIGGYFEADGNVQIANGDNRVIKLTSKYKHHVEGIQYLLLKLGINSYICKEYKRHNSVLVSTVNNKVSKIKDSICYVLYIANSYYVNKFKELIKFKSTYKQERLDSYHIINSKTIHNNLKFELPKSGKGQFFVGKTISNVQGAKVKKVEDIGIQPVYNITANTTHTYITNRFISANTGGTKGSDFSGALEMIYNPSGYHMYPMPNVFDKNSQGKGTSVFFIGAYMNRKGFYDADGNSDVVGASLEVISDLDYIKKHSTDPSTVTQKKAEMPMTIQDCIMRTSCNVYPVADLNERISYLTTNPQEFNGVKCGKFNMNGGEVTFELTADLPIRNFPLKDNRIVGTVEMFKEPEMDPKTNKAMGNRYIIGVDPIDADVADSVSLGSMLVLDTFTDTIVCEYTGRPMFVDDFCEICRRMALYYNARVTYENNKKQMFAYFSRMNSTYLLTDRFEWLSDRDTYKGQAYGNVSKGIVSSVPIKKYGIKLIRDWLLKPCVKTETIKGEEVEVTYPNLQNIKNLALLKELSMHNPDGNFDRHDALVMVMIAREDIMRLYGGNMSERRNDEDKIYSDDFFKTFDTKYAKYNKTDENINFQLIDDKF